MEQFNFFEEKTLTDVSVAELQAMVRLLADYRVLEQEAKDAYSRKAEQVTELEQKVLSVLEAHNMKNFNVDGVGTVYASEKFQVSYPKDPVKAAQFRAFCLSNGFENMLTVNHQTLNSQFKARKEELELQGLLREVSDVFPGVEEPKVYRTIGFRKG